MKEGVPAGNGFVYSGTDNLEAMIEARNYNAYLVGTLARHLRGRQNVLDFGAGIGHFAAQMRDRGFSIACVERDAAHLDLLEGRGFECAASLAEVSRDRFDGAYALNVLEHIEDDDAVLRELYRVLAPGGMLVVYVPAFQVLFSAMDRKVGHFRRYRAAPLRRKLQRQGFRIRHWAYADVLGFLATLLYRLAGNRRGDLNMRGLRAFDRFAFPVSCLLDRLTSAFAGKNLIVVAEKPSAG